MGDVPRIELFARQSPEGWDVWGNEVECSITLGKEVPNGVCTGPEGSESCQDEGHVQPDKAAAHLDVYKRQPCVPSRKSLRHFHLYRHDFLTRQNLSLIHI